MSEQTPLTPDEFERARAIAEAVTKHLADVTTDAERARVISKAASLIRRSGNFAQAASFAGYGTLTASGMAAAPTVLAGEGTLSAGLPVAALSLMSAQALFTIHAGTAVLKQVGADLKLSVEADASGEVDGHPAAADEAVDLGEVYDLLQILVGWLARPQPPDYTAMLNTLFVFLTLLATLIAVRR